MTKALDDNHADVRANAIRLAENSLREGKLHPQVLKKMDDALWAVRRQLAAMTTLLPKYGADQITVDIAISGLAGHESAVLETLLSAGAQREDTVAMLAAAIAKSRKETEISKLFGPASDNAKPDWQRLAILRGIEAGLTAPAGGGGGRPPGQAGRRPGAPVQGFAISAEPKAPLAIAGGADELSTLARQVSNRLNWPGKPAPVNTAPPLTPAEEKLVAEGGRAYANYCAGCHRADGIGNQGGTTNLATSALVPAFPHVILHGKDGKIGLMPPLGGSLNDDQIAAVISYIRRSWGHTESTVSAADIKETRGINKLRKTPWSDDELKRYAAPQ